MKLIFGIMLLITFGNLAAQIQVLPDMEVTGESQVKIFLYKKALPYSHQDVKNDSLSAFLPTNGAVKIPSQQKKLATPKNGYVNLVGSTALDIDASLGYHLDDNVIQSVGLRMISANPEDDYNAYYTTLWSDLAVKWNTSILFPLYTAKADNFSSEYYGAMVGIRNQKFVFLGLDFYSQNTGIRAYKLWQKNQGISINKETVALSHSHEIDFGLVRIGNAMLFNDGQWGYHQYTGFHLLDLEESKVHFLMDNNSFIPSIGFRYRHPLDFDSEFSIQNQPEMVANDYPELMETVSWMSIAKTPPSTLIPWNLRIIGEKHYTANPEQKLKSLSMELSSMWKKDDPILTKGTNPKVPEIGFTDALLNSLLMKAVFQENEVIYSQSLCLNMGHASDAKWQRLPYHHILKLESIANFNMNNYALEVALKQHYFSQDEDGKDLPEFIDFSIGLGYKLGSFTKLHVKADNLLNSPNILHRNLPERGIALFAGIMHLF